MLGLKLNHVSKRGPWDQCFWWIYRLLSKGPEPEKRKGVDNKFSQMYIEKKKINFNEFFNQDSDLWKHRRLNEWYVHYITVIRALFSSVCKTVAVVQCPGSKPVLGMGGNGMYSHRVWSRFIPPLPYHKRSHRLLGTYDIPNVLLFVSSANVICDRSLKSVMSRCINIKWPKLICNWIPGQGQLHVSS